MKYMPERLSVLLKVMIIFEVFAGVHFYLSFYHDSILMYFGNVLLSCLIVSIFLTMVIGCCSKYYRAKELRYLKPLVIALGFAGMLTIPVLIVHAKKISPSVLYCHNANYSNEIYINFMKNGTYEIIVQGIGSIYSRGSYNIHDSIIEVEKNWIDTLIINRRLCRSRDGYIYQVDDANKVISHMDTFVVSKYPQL